MPLQIYDTILILDINIFLSSLHEAPAVSAIFDIFLFDIYIFTKSRDPGFFQDWVSLKLCIGFIFIHCLKSSNLGL